MRLFYSNEEQTVIQVELDEGEILGNHSGPITMFVPTDPANKEYSDILDKQISVDDYVNPVTPKTESL